ncbi:MAG TPA: hypothetical protein VNK96_09125 [Fimbriimonadales bacterium]|nr:hypothetical protein [Fimbriimonadales bacterium]
MGLLWVFPEVWCVNLLTKTFDFFFYGTYVKDVLRLRRDDVLLLIALPAL